MNVWNRRPGCTALITAMTATMANKRDMGLVGSGFASRGDHQEWQEVYPRELLEQEPEKLLPLPSVPWKVE